MYSNNKMNCLIQAKESGLMYSENGAQSIWEPSIAQVPVRPKSEPVEIQRPYAKK